MVNHIAEFQVQHTLFGSFPLQGSITFQIANINKKVKYDLIYIMHIIYVCKTTYMCKITYIHIYIQDKPYLGTSKGRGMKNLF